MYTLSNKVNLQKYIESQISIPGKIKEEFKQDSHANNSEMFIIDRNKFCHTKNFLKRRNMLNKQKDILRQILI